MPTDLGGLMQSVTGLSGQVTKFTSMLGGGNIADAALKQLAGFSGQAGNLGSALGAMLGGQQGAALNPQGKQLAGGIQEGLGKMSGFKLEDLLKLGQSDRRATVDSFSNNSNQVAGMAKQLAAMLGG
jgi:hypothetical protein